MSIRTGRVVLTTQNMISCAPPLPETRNGYPAHPHFLKHVYRAGLETLETRLRGWRGHLLPPPNRLSLRCPRWTYRCCANTWRRTAAATSYPCTSWTSVTSRSTTSRPARHARRTVVISTTLPATGEAGVAVWRSHCRAGVGGMPPVPYYQTLLFFVARGPVLSASQSLARACSLSPLSHVRFFPVCQHSLA